MVKSYRCLCFFIFISSCFIVVSCADETPTQHLPKKVDRSLFQQLNATFNNTEFSIEHRYGDIVISQATFFLFAGGSSLSSDNKLYLQHFAEIIKAYPYDHLDIEAYTDNIGGLLANDEKSTNWARTVYKFLLAQGIPSSKMTYYGYGEFHPIESNFTEAGRLENRRVEIKIK